MKKFSFLFAVLFAAMTMFAGSYTIEFKDGGNSSDSNTGLTSTNISDYVASGAENLSAIAASGKVYNAATGYGLKFGNSSNSGSVTLTLAKAIKPTSIVMSASQYGNTEGSGMLQDSTVDMTGGGGKGKFVDYTMTYDGNTEVTTITVGTKAKRGYVKSVTVNFEGEGPAPIVAPYCATEVGHLFLETPDVNSYVLLSIGALDGKTIVRIDQDAAKNTAMFDFLLVNYAGGSATTGADVAEGGDNKIAVAFDTPTAVNDSITLEILWSTVNWDDRWMVQNVKVPAKAACASAVVPLEVINCAQANGLAKDAKAELNTVTVAYVNGAYVYVQDASGMALVYRTGLGLKAGDVVSGMEVKGAPYNNLPEVIPTNTPSDWTIVEGAAPEFATATAAPVAADVNKVMVWENVAIEGAFEGTKTTIKGAFGEDSIAFYNQFQLSQTFEAGKAYNIVGAVAIYKENVQVYFISAEEYVIPAAQRILAYGLNVAPATGKYIFEFYANMAAAEANLVFYKAGVLAGRVSAGNVVAGKNTVEVAVEDLPGAEGDEMTWAVEVKAAPVVELTEFTDATRGIYDFYLPQGIAVNNCTESAFFGNMYLTEIDGASDGGTDRTKTQKGGIFGYDLLLNELNPTNQGWLPEGMTAGTNRQDMKRITVDNKDGMIYFNSRTAIYKINPADMTTWTNILAGAEGITQVNACYAENGVVYFMDNANTTNGGGTLKKMAADGTISTIVQSALWGVQDNGICGDGRGGLWVAQHRWNADAYSILTHVTAAGVIDYVVDKNASAEVKALFPQNNNASYRGQVAYNAKENLLAFGGNKVATVFKVTYDAETGAPALERWIQTGAIGGNIDGLSFDYAGNLYVLSASVERMYAYGVPVEANEVIVPAQVAQVVTKAAPAPAAFNVKWDLDGGQLVFADKADMFAQFMLDNGVTDAMTLAEYKALDEPLAAPSGICVKLLTCKAMVDMPEKWGWLKTYIQEFSATQEGASALDDNCTSAAWRYAAAAFFTEGQRTGWPKSANFAEAGQVAAYSPAMNAAGYYYELPATMTAESAMPIVVKADHEFLGWFNGAEKVEKVMADCSLKANWNRLVYKVEFVAPFAFPNPMYAADKDAMYKNLNEDYNTFYNQTSDWGVLSTFTAVTDGMPTKGAQFDLTFFANEDMKAKWGWLLDYCDTITARQSTTEAPLTMPSTNASFMRYSVNAFFMNTQRTGWPKSADFALCGIDTEEWKSFWGYSYTLPEVITEEYTLPKMYRKNYEYGGWFTDAEYTNAITKVGPKDNLTVYAKMTPTATALLSITLNKQDTVDLVMPATDQLVVTYNPENAANKNVTWYTENEAIATVVDGLVTPVMPGIVKITVISEESALEASVVYRITAAAGAVTGVTLNEASMTLELGAVAKLIATVAPEDATNKAVTWESSSKAVSVDQEGNIKADTVGVATITVTTVDGGYTATCKVTVPEPFYKAINVEKVWELAIPTTLADIGDCRNGMGWNGKFYVTDKKAQKVRVFTKDGEDANAAIEFNAAADSLKIGTGIAIDDAGNIAVGTNFPNSVTGLYIIKNGTTTPVYIDLTGANALPQNGRCDQITAFGDFFSEAGGMVAYYTSGATQIQYAKIANGALVEVKAINAAVTKGASPSQVYALNADMTFVSHARGSAMQKYNGTEVVTLSLKNVVNNDLGAAFFQVAGQNLAAYKVGTVHSSEFSIRNLDAEQFLVDKDGNSVFYFVDNKAASNNSYANFSKVEKINDYASYLYVFTSGKGAAMYKVYKDVAVTGVALDKTEATLNALETLQLTATVAPAEATVKDVTWGSSDENVATVDENGLVTAVAAGNATITVTTVEGGYTATCALTVSAVTYYRLTDAKQLVDGAKMIIVGGDSVTMGDKQNNNFKANAPVVVANNAIASLPTNATVITLGKVAKGYTMYTSYGYLVAGTSNSNYLKTVETIPTDNDLAYWTITVNPAATVIVNVDTNSKRNTIRYNTGSAIISAYATGQEDVQIFIDNNGSTTGWENINDENISVTKFIRNNQLYILRDGVLYNAQGAVVR
ncbi:MAG: Ig-like domain-containing protein [Paludibacteraceae bacterium]|nr:Ig-like domain-containing protein [Paludibacteraceae bacterium]